MNYKQIFSTIRTIHDKFYYDDKHLSKIFIVKFMLPDYMFQIYKSGSSTKLYLTIYDFLDNEAEYFAYNNETWEIGIDDEYIIIPDINAHKDEWFNFNIQYCNLNYDDFYPELDGLGELLLKQYNKVYINELERRLNVQI